MTENSGAPRGSKIVLEITVPPATHALAESNDDLFVFLSNAFGGAVEEHLPGASWALKWDDDLMDDSDEWMDPGRVRMRTG